jgi:hypothetical protein
MGSFAKTVLALALVGVLVIFVGLVLTLKDARYSQAGAMPFSFEYKGLYRRTAQAGDYVEVARSSKGMVTDSYAVAPLSVGPYSGNATGELPLFADGYIRRLEGRFQHFRLEGEGKTRISSNLAGYDVIYTAWSGGHRLYGRDVLLLSNQTDGRSGVAIEMLSTKPASSSKPVAGSGILETPLKTFSFG